MKVNYYLSRSFKNDLAFVALALTVSFSINFIQRYIPLGYFRSPLVNSVNTLEWRGDLSGLVPGTYYVSVGRPTGSCDLKLDGTLYSTTGISGSKLRQSLSLGAAFSKTPEGPSVITVNCTEQLGFPSGLTDRPVVLPYFYGRVLQAYREFVSIWLAAFAGLILFLFMLTLAPPGSNDSQSAIVQWSKLSLLSRMRNPFVVFSLVATAYGVSMSYIAWLFIRADSATFVHIILRTLLSYCFLQLGKSFLNKKNAYWRIYLLILSVYLVVFVVFGSSKYLIVTYKITHPLFGISTFLMYIDLCKRHHKGHSSRLMARVTLIWAVAQVFDSALWLANSASYSAPVMLAIITWSVAVISRAEVELLYRIEKVIARVLDLLGLGSGIEETIRNVGVQILRETHFKRISVYVDAFCIGHSTEPHKQFVQIHRDGYVIEERMNKDIFIEQGQGQLMFEAMASSLPIFKCGMDHAWFCVIPVGRLACINFSDSISVDPYDAEESMLVIKRLLPVIKVMEDRLLTANLYRNIFLQKMKSVKGFGAWELCFGAIRIDIVDSSANTSKYQMLSGGKDVYGEFIQGSYIPAMLRALNGYADLEQQAGDDLYLVVIPELIGSAEKVEVATSKAILKIAEFIQIDGARICAEQGFPPVKWIGGAMVGQGLIVCDEFKVRSSGEVANLVKRLQDVAVSGSILIEESLACHGEFGEAHLGDKGDYLVKKDRFSGRPLFCNSVKKRVA